MFLKCTIKYYNNNYIYPIYKNEKIKYIFLCGIYLLNELLGT